MTNAHRLHASVTVAQRFREQVAAVSPATHGGMVADPPDVLRDGRDVGRVRHVEPLVAHARRDPLLELSKRRDVGAG